MTFLWIVWWIAILPFVLLYGAYEGPKVWWLWMGGFVLTAQWLLQKRDKLHVTTSGKQLLVWIVVLGIASIAGIHPWESFAGGSYRHQGVLFFFTLFLIGETISRFTARLQKYFLIILALSVLIESLIVIIQKSSNWPLRPLGTFGEPNAVAGFLAIGLYWIIRSHWLPRVIRYPGYAATLSAVALTESRSGIIAAGIVTIGIGLRILAQTKHKATLFSLILSGFIACGIAGYTYVRIIGITRSTSHFENRTEFWRMGFAEFIRRPLLGFGAESQEVVYDRAYKKISMPLVDFMIDRSHNIFLDVAMWSGVIGLVVFGWWLGDVFRTTWNARDVLRLWALVAWLVFAFVQPVGAVHWVQLILLAHIRDPLRPAGAGIQTGRGLVTAGKMYLTEVHSEGISFFEYVFVSRHRDHECS